MSPRDGPSADSDDEDLVELCRNLSMGNLQHMRGASQSPSKGSEEAADE